MGGGGGEGGPIDGGGKYLKGKTIIGRGIEMHNIRTTYTQLKGSGVGRFEWFGVREWCRPSGI